MSDGIFKKTKDFFGIGGAEVYTDGYYGEDYARDRERGYRDDREARREYPAVDRGFERGVERAEPRDDRYAGRPGYSAGYDAGARGGRYAAEPASRPAEPAVPARPSYTSMILSSYKQAGDLVDVLREGEVVAFSLSGMEKGEARRVLDFAAGLCRGLDAKIDKLSGVRNFIMIPKGITLEKDQLDALAEQL